MLLSARGIDKHFDGTQALGNVDLQVEAGTVHALVGENGAGKSTLAKIIAGVVKPDAGDLLFDGEPVSLRDPVAAQRLGIGIIFQELDVFPHLSVADNLTVGCLGAESGAWLNQRDMRSYCEPLLREIDLRVPLRTPVAELSIAQMQLVLIARALGMNARLLVMDEPTSALSADNAEKLFGVIARLKQKGVAILYVSHKMDEIFRLSDRITVLRDGANVGSVATADTNTHRIIAMMVGRELEAGIRQRTSGTGKILLHVERLSSRKLAHISFELRAGEVLGISGLVGSGRSSLASALFGLDPTVSGTIQLQGRPYVPRSPEHAIESGIGLLPEDRKTMGLMMQMTVEENVTISILHKLQRFGFLRSGAARDQAGGITRRLRVKAAGPEAAVSTLSGGNQQKVLLARWLLVNPEVIILDDPTRGIDIGAKYDIYEVIRTLSDAGKGVVLISSELPELIECSDRILVLHEGWQAGILDRAEATQQRIMALATRTTVGADSC
ncbi:MAG TPA: sugar ABC transporter ATP-binding protein [Bryobacteraceae bacterium]|nr:sugar ABC transporter ATP-binding protein [Bryobacteraceae bacterium]